MSLASVKNRSKAAREVWKELTSLAVWVAASFGSFLTYRVKLSLFSDYETSIVGFAQFLVAAIAGLVFAGVSSRHFAQDRKRCRRIASALLVICVLFFLAFLVLQAIWTCTFAGRFTLVIGHTLTDHAKAHVQRYPGLSCSHLIADYAGETERIYVKNELVFRFTVIALMYMLAWSLVAAVVLAIANLFKASGPKRI